MAYTMQIERRLHNAYHATSEIINHPFHLGTDHAVAKTFVFEQLRQPDVLSVALRWNNGPAEIYDHRDLEEEGA